MKTLSALLVLGIMLTSGLAIAQNKGRGQYAFDRKYDRSTQTNIQGTIKSIEKVYGNKSYAGIHLVIQTTSGEIPVHLGPQWYIEKQSISFNVGDKIEVEGSRVTINNKPALIARKVKKGKEILELRNQDGIPLWSRSGQR